MVVNDIEVTVKGIADISEQEIQNYINRIEEEEKASVESLIISALDDGKVELDYNLHPQKFERIRRITGYLVGTVDRWNDAKKAEEEERVKHGMR